MRTYPWRPALPTRWNSNQAGGSITSIHGRWTVAPWPHGRIYVGGRWHEHSSRALKLLTGNNSAYLARDGRFRLTAYLFAAGFSQSMFHLVEDNHNASWRRLVCSERDTS